MENAKVLIGRFQLAPDSIEEIHYWYKYAAELLIEEGTLPKHKIVGKLYEDFEQFYGERHIRRILKERGIDLPEENGHLSVSDSSGFTHGLTRDSPHWQERLSEIWMLNEIKQDCERGIDKLGTDYEIEYTESGQPVKIPLNWDEYFEDAKEHKGYLDALKDIFANIVPEWTQHHDERQKHLDKEFIPYVATAGVFNSAATGRRYHGVVKRTLMLTSKKMSHILRLQIGLEESNLLRSIREEAWKWDTLDVQCPNCKNAFTNEIYKYQLRVWVYVDGHWDFHCANCDQHFAHSLFSERIAQLATNKGGAATQYCRKRGIIDEKESNTTLEVEDGMTGSLNDG